MKKIILTISLVAVLLLLGIEYSFSSNQKVYKLGYRKNFAPYEFIDDKGVPSGAVIDIFRVFCKTVDLQIQFVPCDDSKINAMLDNGEIDLILSVPIKEEYDANFDTNKFTQIYYHTLFDYCILYNKKKVTVHSFADIKKTKNISYHKNILNSIFEQKGIKSDNHNDIEQIIKKVYNGEYDCAVIPELSAMYFISQNPKYFDNVSIFSDPIHTVTVGAVGHIKDSFFIERLQDVRLDEEADSVFSWSTRQWLKNPRDRFIEIVSEVSAKSQHRYQIIIILTAVVSVALIIISILFFRVRKQTAKVQHQLDVTYRQKLIQGVVFHISEAITNSDDLMQIYKLMHEQIQTLMFARNFYVAIYDPENEQIDFPYFVDEYDAPPPPRKLQNGLTEYVIFSKKPFFSKPHTFSKMSKEKNIAPLGTRSLDWLGVPLTLEDKPLGAIVVQSYTQGIEYSEEDKDVLVHIANQISLAISRKDVINKLQDLNNILEHKVIERTKLYENVAKELRLEIEERKETLRVLENTKEELRQALEQEKEVSEMKTRFVGIISHEYRTPLTVIMSSTYLIEKFFDLQLKDEFKKSIVNIQLAIKSMTNLMDDVLTVENTKNEKLIPKYSEVPVVKFVRSIIDDVKIEDKSNHLFEIISNNKDLTANTDINMLSTILVNLLSNAVKFSPNNSLITVGIFDSEDFFDISIEDRGIGIPEDERRYLFELYHRFSNVGTVTGIGLGLSITKRYVDALGGQISLKSKENVGSIFTVTLPNKQKSKDEN